MVLDLLTSSAMTAALKAASLCVLRHAGAHIVIVPVPLGSGQAQVGEASKADGVAGAVRHCSTGAVWARGATKEPLQGRDHASATQLLKRSSRDGSRLGQQQPNLSKR